MWWEMLSHFIILSNKWVQEVIRQMAPWLAQGKWRNTLRMTRMASLRGCCYYAVVAPRKQMMIWGCSPRNKLKLWIQALLKKPRKTQKAFLEWPHIDLHPSCWETVVLLLPLKIEWGFGVAPLLIKGWNSGIRLYSKKPERFSEMTDPQKSPPWGSA